MSTVTNEAAAPVLPPSDEFDDVFEFIEALMNADMSYADLPITNPHLTVRDVIEPGTWDRDIAVLKQKTANGLDVERLWRVLSG